MSLAEVLSGVVEGSENAAVAELPQGAGGEEGPELLDGVDEGEAEAAEQGEASSTESAGRYEATLLVFPRAWEVDPLVCIGLR